MHLGIETPVAACDGRLFVREVHVQKNRSASTGSFAVYASSGKKPGT